MSTIKMHTKSPSGVVHEVIQVSNWPDYRTRFSIACNHKNFEPFPAGWKKTNDAVTCKHCLQGREGKPIRYKLFECKYITAKGPKISHMIAQNRTDAGLGLLLQGRIKHTSIHIDITEVKMDKRIFLACTCNS